MRNQDRQRNQNAKTDQNSLGNTQGDKATQRTPLSHKPYLIAVP